MSLRKRLTATLRKAIRSAAPQTPKTSFRQSKPPLPQQPDQDGFVAITHSDRILEGKGNSFMCKDRVVAVFRTQGKLYAIDNACTHEDGPLGEGHLEGHTLQCPYHDWRFDIRSGECFSQKDRNISCYEVREKEGFVWVGKIYQQGSTERGGEHDDGLRSPQITI